MENQIYTEFSMRELFFFLKKKLWVILLLALIGALGGYLWSKAMVTPTYMTDSQIYVYEKTQSTDATTSDGEPLMNYGGLQVATQLRRDCEILICGKSVTSKVVEQLGLHMSPEALGSGISVSSVENTRVLKVTYTDTDPQRAALILNTVCQVAQDELKQVMNLDVVTVLYEAEVPTAPTTQGTKHYATVGGIGGLVVSLVLLVVCFLVDDTIHNEEDVKRYLELPTLAAIPVSKELGNGTQRTVSKRILSGLHSRKRR